MKTDADFSADAVNAALGKWCEELYAEKQEANAGVPWLTKSAEELKAKPPLFRWAFAKKSGLRAGIEPDSEKNVELMISFKRIYQFRRHDVRESELCRRRTGLKIGALSSVGYQAAGP